MSIKAKHVLLLLSELLKETDQEESKTGFRNAGEMIKEKTGRFGENYLYNLYRQAKGKASDMDVTPQARLINVILKYLQYKSLSEFVRKMDSQVDSQLTTCEGSYYSYVRRSMNVGTIYRSPVRIFLKDGKMIMELKGGRLKYTGEITLKAGCLFVPLESVKAKGFYHVYKIGDSETPKVMQGMFSGVSNTFEPIAGRAVLIRSEKKFDDLKNAELEITKLEKSGLLEEKRIAEYFKTYSKNNLVLNRVYSFDLNDLRTPK